MGFLKKRIFGFTILTILIVAAIGYVVVKKGLIGKAAGVVTGGTGGEMPGAVGAVNAT